MTDRPHRFPQPVPDADVIGWKCAACGSWVSEFRPTDAGPCPVDWRADRRAEGEQ